MVLLHSHHLDDGCYTSVFQLCYYIRSLHQDLMETSSPLNLMQIKYKTLDLSGFPRMTDFKVNGAM